MHKARVTAPGAVLLLVAGGLGAFAVASAYRLSLRLLERGFMPATASLVATAMYGAAAGGAAVAGVSWFRAAPAPLPVATAQRATDAAAEGIAGTSRSL